MPLSDFAKCLEDAQRRLKRANAEFVRMEQLAEKKDMRAFASGTEAKKLALPARV